MLKRRLIFFLLFLTEFYSYGQFFESGQDPSYLRWKQILSKHTKIIYPSGYEKNAIRMADILEQASAHVSSSMAIEPKRVPVIIHTQSVESNGFVALAPRRMELYALPPQDIYSQDWLEQLGLHEYRHIVQMDKLNHGWTKVLSLFVGQQAPGAVAGLTPRWFLEGDAVHSETSYSSSGRGRLPSFEMELRALTLNRGNIYNYDKMLNGSYKDYVPDYYQYGYKMVAYGRLKYGNDLWEKVLEYTGSHPFRIVPFTLGLMKYSGLNKKELQKNAFNYYDSIWQQQDRILTASVALQLNKRTGSDYTDYKYPQITAEKNYIALKTGLDQVPQIISIDSSGAEKVLLKTGPVDIVRLSLSNDILVWAEIRGDPRWDNRSYSIIRKLNIKTGKAETLSQKTRYYAPCLSPDAKKIAAVSLSTQGDCSIVLLDAANGKLLSSIPGPSSFSLLIEPSWIDNSNIALILLEHENKSIQSLNINLGVYRKLFDAGNNDIADLDAGNGMIFFRASYSGIDNIYFYSMAANKIFRISSSHFGAFYPSLSVDGKQLIYSDYSYRGFNLSRLKLDTSVLVPAENIISDFNSSYSSVSRAENINNWRLKDRDTVIASRPYRKVLNLFNFHSWLPFYYDYSQINLNNPAIYPGLSFISQNLLGTALSSVGYWRSAGNNYFQADFTYKGFYPVFDFHFLYGGWPSYYSYGTNFVPSLKKDFAQSSLQIYIPLLYTINSHYLQFYPSIYFVHNNEYLYSRNDGVYKRGVSFLQLDLLLYQFSSLSLRDLAPKFGQILRLKYLSVPWNTELYGSSYDVSATIFLPGIANHHSIQLQAAYEQQFLKVLYLDDQITLPTGLADFNVAEQVRFASASYSLPLLYPDFRVGPFFYLKRLRGRAFFDYASIQNALFYGRQGEISTNISSTGVEILGDFHLLRFFYPFEGGIKIYSLNEFGKKNVQYQMVIKLNMGKL